MILYPTETIYGLGVNALDDGEVDVLFVLKGRDERKTVSWLVRDIEDIRLYAEVSDRTVKIASRFLPGPLTLVLPAKDTVPTSRQAEDGTVGFRISSDPIAQKLISDFWNKHQAPLTCTSANVSGAQSEKTPDKIIEQFQQHHPTFRGFDEVIDDGERNGLASTIVKIIGEEITIIREGSISAADILST